jgi:menaquinone-dependent protoporphyrinogen oxidase
MKVLITAASKHGSTTEIAWAIRGHLVEEGLQTVVIHPDEITELVGYDAVIVGSAVYAGRWLKPAKELVERLRSELGDIPVWLFSSGPVGDPPVPTDEDAVDVADVAAATGARDHRLFPGRIDMSTLGFAERALVRALRVPAGDFRDWPAIGAWSKQIAAELQPADPTG